MSAETLAAKLERARILNALHDAAQALRTPPAPMEAVAWRDIATAPRDGTVIIGLTKHREVCRVWWFLFEEGWNWQDDDDSEHQLTHWMPLPPLPSADSLGGDVAKRSEPDALPGDLRERVARIVDPSAFLFSRDELDAKVPHHPHDAAYAIADAILSLIQSERGGA